jgi:hypothetical protein
MYYLAEVIPGLRRINFPLSRDQMMLLMAAINQIFLGIDIYLAHSISGTIVFNEWIPIIFGPAAGALLLLAGLLAYRNRELAKIIATLVFILSIAVGLLGAYFHFVRAILPTGPADRWVSVDLLVWAPPILGPLTFSLVGLLGISAAWRESPPDSGTLELLVDRRLHLPYSKTRAYVFLVAFGTLATVTSSILDHARVQFENPWLWIPTVSGLFATVVAFVFASMDHPSKEDLATYIFAMALITVVGVIGALLHVQDNLVSGSIIVTERFIRGAPFLAPLLFANMGALGVIALLDPDEPV